MGLAISLSGAILIEDFLSLQIAIASSSDKHLLFSRLCKHHFIHQWEIITSGLYYKHITIIIDAALS
jgi:hypothetical protein